MNEKSLPAKHTSFEQTFSFFQSKKGLEVPTLDPQENVVANLFQGRKITRCSVASCYHCNEFSLWGNIHFGQ